MANPQLARAKLRFLSQQRTCQVKVTSPYSVIIEVFVVVPFQFPSKSLLRFHLFFKISLTYCHIKRCLAPPSTLTRDYDIVL